MPQIAARSLGVALSFYAVGLLGCAADAVDSTPEVEAPTYWGTLKGVVDSKCVGCHVPGGIAPFSLASYADLVEHGEAAVSAIEAGTMPPWPPRSECSDYRFDRSLSAQEKSSFSAWLQAGKLEGAVDQGQAATQSSAARLSRTDLQLSLPEPYTPTNGPDDYRCFLVDWPSAAPRYVTGFGVVPGVAAIVHHVIAFLAAPEQLATFQGLDDADEGPGWSCFGGPGGDQVAAAQAGWVGGWAPGSLGADFPAGTGIEVPEGAKIVVQLHYNTLTAPPQPDQTSIVLKLDEQVEKRAFMMPWADINWVVAHTMEIPAHGANVTHEWSRDPTPYLGFLTDGAFAANTPITLHSASLHMHTRGKSAETYIARADGSETCLLGIDRWNFHWQGSYGFEEPKVLNPGDRLNLACTWDNPSNETLNWGEGTGDEMCLGVYYVTQ